MLSVSSNKVKSRRFAGHLGKTILGAALLVGVSGTAFAQSMVVRSTGPSASSYPAGTKLPNNARVTLQRQDQLTVLSKAGTRVLKGPGTYTLNQRTLANSTRSTRLSSFINNRSNRRARTGAVRASASPAVEATPSNPNLWYLDVTKGGKFCVIQPNTLVLWRPDYTGSATASIVAPDSGKVTQVEWRQGNPLKAWPRMDAPVADGASYRVLGSNVGQSVEVEFVVLPSQPQNEEEAASMLIEKGCQSQLDLLIETATAGQGDNQG